MYKVDLIYLEPTEPDVTGDVAEANRAKNRALLNEGLAGAKCTYAGSLDCARVDVQGFMEEYECEGIWEIGTVEEYHGDCGCWFEGANVHMRWNDKHVAFVRIRVVGTTESEKING